jgi:hypothetical protein
MTGTAMIENLRDIYGRIVTRIKHPHEKVIVPLAYLQAIFHLNDVRFIQDPYFQTMVDFGLGINDMNRPAVTRVFETDPNDKVYVTIKSDDLLYDSVDEIRSFPASPMIVHTDYKLSALSDKRGIALLIRPRLERAKDDITVAFGLYGEYDPKAGDVTIKKLILLDPRTEKAIKPHIHEETVVRALEFGRLCAEDMTAKRKLNLNNNMHMAVTLQNENLRPGWKAPKP